PQIHRPPTSTLFAYTTLFRSKTPVNKRHSERRIVGCRHHIRQIEINISITVAVNSGLSIRNRHQHIAQMIAQFKELITSLKIRLDRKSTRLNSSHVNNSYAVF